AANLIEVAAQFVPADRPPNAKAKGFGVHYLYFAAGKAKPLSTARIRPFHHFDPSNAVQGQCRTEVGRRQLRGPAKPAAGNAKRIRKLPQVRRFGLGSTAAILVVV